MTEPILPPETEKRVEKATSAHLKDAEGIVLREDEDVATASLYLKAIADTRKLLDEERQFLVRPLNEHVKAINDRFKSLAEPIVEADRILRAKIGDYRAEQAKLQLEEQRRLNEAAARLQKQLEAEAAAEGVEAPTVRAGTFLPPASRIGNVNMRRVWKFDVLDEDLVPREYMVADEAAIRKAIAAGVRKIPGVRIYQDEQIAVR